MENAALPHRAISPDEQAEIDQNTAWISDHQSTYDVFRDRYFDALDALNDEKSQQHPSSAKLQRLTQKLDEANANWEVLGKKSDYENRQAQVIYLSSGDPSQLWKGFKDKYRSQSRKSPNRGYYQQTFLIPPASQWSSPRVSWSRFEKTINEADSYSYSSQTSWGASGSAGWGLFSARVSVGGSSKYEHSESDVTTVSVAFDYIRIRISRPWLVSDVFGYHFWWWKKAFGYKLLSDGGNLHITPPVRPIGTIPFIPNYMIVARNVAITSNFSHNDATHIQNSFSSSGGGGWGPFSVSGYYNSSSGSHRTNASFDGTTIRIDQPQIIAFTGSLMPRCPNPDRTLPWRDDHAPFDPPKDIVTQHRQLLDEEMIAARRRSMMSTAIDMADHRRDSFIKSARNAAQVDESKG